MNTREGFATLAGTEPTSFPGGPFEKRRRSLYRGGPKVSHFGFGCYRVGLEPRWGGAEGAVALEDALRRGVNLIDTSANYTNGQSEIVIGRTLEKLIDTEGLLKRENVVVVSKVGYLQGGNIELATQRENRGEPFEDVFKFGEQVWYSISPDFLEDQIERSLKRLQLSTIDCLLLHNPEYILKRFELDKVPQKQAKERFYQLIKKAFAKLEEFVAQGKIKSYGVSSNTLGFSEEDPSAVSIMELHKVANGVAADNHFKVVQCPLNWLEVVPAFLPHESYQATTLGYAMGHGIGLLVNRPLNAMYQDSAIRLTRPTVPPDEVGQLGHSQQKGYQNWLQLSQDLEKLAQESISSEAYSEKPLQQLVLSTLSWLPGVTTVLCGARKQVYVDDLENAARLPTLPNAMDVLLNIYENLEFHK